MKTARSNRRQKAHKRSQLGISPVYQKSPGAVANETTPLKHTGEVEFVDDKKKSERSLPSKMMDWLKVALQAGRAALLAENVAFQAVKLIQKLIEMISQQ